MRKDTDLGYQSDDPGYLAASDFPDYSLRARDSKEGGLTNIDATTVAEALGWLSIGFGVAHLVAPRAVSKFFGIKDRDALMRLAGMRNLVTGIGILSRPDARGWMWSRVAGDLVDLAMLGTVLEPRGKDHGGLRPAALMVGGILAADYLCAHQLSSSSDGTMAKSRLYEARESIVINRPRDEIFEFWRNFENLPTVMSDLERVRVIDERRSHWVIKSAVKSALEWDAEIVHEEPGRLIEWRSVEEADVEHFGRVSFSDLPENRGTLVEVYLRYKPPGGALGQALADLVGDNPQKKLRHDLRNFRQHMEQGEFGAGEQPPEKMRGEAWRADASHHGVGRAGHSPSATH